MGSPDNLLSGCRRHKRGIRFTNDNRRISSVNQPFALMLLRNPDNELSGPPGNYNSAQPTINDNLLLVVNELDADRALDDSCFHASVE